MGESKAYKIIRKSIYTFLQHYQYFTITIAVLAFPYSVSLFLSQSFIPKSPVFHTIHRRIVSLTNAAGFDPPISLFSSKFLPLLNLKLSQTISTAILCFPFTFTSLLITKCCIILSLFFPTKSLSFHSISSIYKPIAVTYILNSLIIVSIHSTAITLFIFGLDFIKGSSFFTVSSQNLLTLFSILSSFIYSVFLANTIVICNLALISSGVDKKGGVFSILKASVLIQGNFSTALFLALPSNLVMTAIEALFQYRVVQIYHHAEKLSVFMVIEGLLIAYLYSNVIVLDTIVSCNFFKRCKTKTECFKFDDHDHEEEVCRFHYCRIDIKEENNDTHLKKNFKNLNNVAKINFSF